MDAKRSPGRPPKSRAREDDARDEAGEARNPTDRRERIPMGGMQLKLAVPKKPGMHFHWAADRGMNLARYKAAGYEFVNDEKTIDEAGDGQGTRISRISGSETLYLMEIPQKWYDEDQSKKQLGLDEIDDQLRRGHHKNVASQDAGAMTRGSDRGDIVIETLDGRK